MEDKVIAAILLFFMLMCLVTLLIKNNNKDKSIEGLSSVSNAIDSEALENLSSLYNSQNLTVSNLTITSSFNLLPKGIIAVWNQTVAPSGWNICDGTNGTPDLRGRFIIGVNNNDALGNTGGERMHTLTTSEIPAHNHKWAFGYGNNGGANLAGDKDGDLYQNPHLWGISDTTGGGQAHNNMPPYYTLTYIMKL